MRGFQWSGHRWAWRLVRVGAGVGILVFVRGVFCGCFVAVVVSWVFSRELWVHGGRNRDYGSARIVAFVVPVRPLEGLALAWGPWVLLWGPMPLGALAGAFTGCPHVGTIGGGCWFPSAVARLLLVFSWASGVSLCTAFPRVRGLLRVHGGVRKRFDPVAGASCPRSWPVSRAPCGRFSGWCMFMRFFVSTPRVRG